MREVELIDKYQAAKILSCSTETLPHYRRMGKIIDGIHLIRRNSRVNRYVKYLIEDLAINWDDPIAHQRAIDRFALMMVG